MSDLISRKVLLRELKNYVEHVYECDFDDPRCTSYGYSLNPKFVQGLWEAKEIIEEFPTAYDVKKIIEELEDERQSALAMADDSEYFLGQLSLLNGIIPLVKRGGKDE